MSDVTPINPDIVPQVDGERELADYLLGRLRGYCAKHGEAPNAVAVVLLSRDMERTDAHTFSVVEQPRYVTCAVAAMALTHRAIGRG